VKTTRLVATRGSLVVAAGLVFVACTGRHADVGAIYIRNEWRFPVAVTIDTPGHVDPTRREAIIFGLPQWSSKYCGAIGFGVPEGDSKVSVRAEGLPPEDAQVHITATGHEQVVVLIGTAGALRIGGPVPADTANCQPWPEISPPAS